MNVDINTLQQWSSWAWPPPRIISYEIFFLPHVIQTYINNNFQKGLEYIQNWIWFLHFGGLIFLFTYSIMQPSLQKLHLSHFSYNKYIIVNVVSLDIIFICIVIIIIILYFFLFTLHFLNISVMPLPEARTSIHSIGSLGSPIHSRRPTISFLF